MIPCYSMSNRINGLIANAIFSGKSRLISFLWIKCAFDLSNICFGKLGHSGLRSSVKNSATFFNHVSHVVKLSSRKQMFRIYASRIVALVTNIMSFWNRPNKYFVRNSVSLLLSTINSKYSISTSALMADPFPTFITMCNRYLFKKCCLSNHKKYLSPIDEGLK